MCLDKPKKKVDIPKMIGYVFAVEVGEGQYRPHYFRDFQYKLGERYKAEYKYPGSSVDSEVEGSFSFAINKYINKVGMTATLEITDGGFYFFEDFQAVKRAIGGFTLPVVGLRCEFEEVFEKGKWGGFVAYRAMYRTILEALFSN